MNDCCAKSCEDKVMPINRKWLIIGLYLGLFTILYNLLEAVIAVIAGEKADSIALLGFGLDSLIEVSAAILISWRLYLQVKDDRSDKVEQLEGKIHRFVGGSFILLALYVGYESIIKLLSGEHPAQTTIGIVLASLSLIIMPALAFMKIKAARKIPSAALESEAKETIACSLLSLILLVGLVLNALLGWWWADPVAGLVMLPWLLKEGIAGLKGESCCG
jgi:divalent metal cation (Fe/Co/Zn/Cd) transporter